VSPREQFLGKEAGVSKALVEEEFTDGAILIGGVLKNY
jgi:hypothetical protein